MAESATGKSLSGSESIWWEIFASIAQFPVLQCCAAYTAVWGWYGWVVKSFFFCIGARTCSVLEGWVLSFSGSMGVNRCGLLFECCGVVLTVRLQAVTGRQRLPGVSFVSTRHLNETPTRTGIDYLY